MKKYYLILCLAIISFSSFGDTIIEFTGTPITGIWKKDNSPYILTQSRYENHITNLTIEPGVVIRCNSFSFAKCDSLIICGSSSDPIIFETENGGSFGSFNISHSKFVHLKNIQFKNNISGLKFDYDTVVHLENIELPLISSISIQYTVNTLFDNVSIKTSKATLTPQQSPLQMRGCDIRNVTFNILQSPLEISNSMITNDQNGSYFEFIGDSTPIILTNNNIINCKSSQKFMILRANYFTMSGCTFNNNSFGIEIQQCDTVKIHGNTIINNAESFRIFSTKHITLSGNLISHNKSPGIRFLNGTGTARISNNLISNNISSEYILDSDQNGAGICSSNRIIPDNDSLILSGNTIVNNHASRYGGAVCLNANFIKLVNNTIANNYSKLGSAVIISSPGSIYNTIIYGNKSDSSDKQISFFRKSSKESFVKNCLIENGLNGIGCCDSVMDFGISPDNPVHSFDGQSDLIVKQVPGFFNPSLLADTTSDGAACDWRLSQTSPCIDHGSASYYDSTFSTTDYWGNKRIINNIIDIGANEYSSQVKVHQKGIRNAAFLIHGYKHFDLLGRAMMKPVGSSKTLISSTQERRSKKTVLNIKTH